MRRTLEGAGAGPPKITEELYIALFFEWARNGADSYHPLGVQPTEG